jgi:hypothetical protein
MTTMPRQGRCCWFLTYVCTYTVAFYRLVTGAFQFKKRSKLIEKSVQYSYLALKIYSAEIFSRFARWYIFIPKIPILKDLDWDVGIFNGRLVYFMLIWYI